LNGDILQQGPRAVGNIGEREKLEMENLRLVMELTTIWEIDDALC